jgi:hypothetical protein
MRLDSGWRPAAPYLVWGRLARNDGRGVVFVIPAKAAIQARGAGWAFCL